MRGALHAKHPLFNDCLTMKFSYWSVSEFIT
ncbi:MAG: hypothetical protein ACI9FR_002540, partial [Cryomorphaceae bacterium]